MATRKKSKGKGRAKAASRKVVKLKSKAIAAKKANVTTHALKRRPIPMRLLSNARYPAAI